MSVIPPAWHGQPHDPELSQPELLQELFEAQADARPSEPALVCGKEQLTYAEVETRANQLAHSLRARGVGRGTLVGILLPRSADIHIAILGVLKAGAAYVPLDADYPADRVSYILEDCAAAALITTVGLANKAPTFHGAVVLLDIQRAELAAERADRLTRAETGTTWGDLCYVIYTSGSTGRPKGVQIEHRSACNLVRAEGRIFQVRPRDRVYQGFSVAFDASVEEIWLAFFAGATLVVGTPEMVQAGPELSGLLVEAGVTVFSCVPTLLSMMDEDVPTLRLLILGGEPCPQDLVRRWCRPGRRMVNTYGPTEATVIATYGECNPESKVTIGRPAPNCSVFILNQDLRPVLPGETGEIHIAGICLSRGYIGRDDLTRQKFIANPFAAQSAGCSRLYKTGDLGRWTPNGEIEFMGRADTQVKLRGFRVELSEIESVLLQCPSVRAAAVAVREDIPGIQQLVGYIVPRETGRLERHEIRGVLRSRLPGYMIPPILEALAELPTLPSGKVDRKQLPAPQGRQVEPKPAHAAPRTELEKKIVAVWERLFEPTPVSIRDDFFVDLGGHSLLAAGMVSELRQDHRCAHLSIRDVYNFPTVEALASYLGKQHEETNGTNGTIGSRRHEDGGRRFHAVSPIKHFFCGLAQFFALYAVVGFYSLQWLAPYLTYSWMIDAEYSIGVAILGSVVVLLGLYPVMLALTIVAKWTILGRFRPGAYPLWGAYYFRWWFVKSLMSGVPSDYLAGTPLLNIYYRLLGAKIGRNVYLGGDDFFTFDLLEIGDDSSIGRDTHVLGYTVENGMLHVGSVRVGSNCRVGNRCVLREQSSLGDDARLEDLSMLPRGSQVPSGECWLGSPARPNPLAEAAPPPAERPSLARRLGFGLMYAFSVFVLPLVVLGAIFPGMVLINYLAYYDDYGWYLLASPFVGLSFVVLLCLEIAAVKWLLLGKVKAGRYPLHTWFYWRKWFVDQLLDLSLDILGPLYATIYLAPWYRLLGAHIGKRAEISTASFISPDLLHMDDEGFIADSVSLGAARVENGFMTIGECRIGKRSFIGNSALLPPGATIGDNCLIGCLSAPPRDGEEAARESTSWLGSPSFCLPQRQQSAVFPEATTYTPTRKLWLQRAAIEYARVTLPSTVFIVLTSVLLSAVLLIRTTMSLGALLFLFPLLYAACGVAAALFTAAMKWLLMGKFKPGEWPLWSTFVWRNEFVTSLHENLAVLYLVGLLEGTPFICWWFRLLGARIGRRVYVETTDLIEFDLVDVGDEAALNRYCTLQTHLFEDRVFKMSFVRIGRRCSVGGMSLVLYDTVMEDGASLGDLSLLMKGECLPSGTGWEGIPATRHKALSAPLPTSRNRTSHTFTPPAIRLPVYPLPSSQVVDTRASAG